MKIRPFIPCTLLAISLTCLAQEPNPFVKKEGAKAPEKSSSENSPESSPDLSYVGIVEHILVPPDLIDGWMRKNGMPADASNLRAAVQQWVVEGKATLDHTSVGVGVTGQRAKNESILEQIYPTEYQQNGSGVWPLPTSFETRNLGYTAEFLGYTDEYATGPGGGAPRLSMEGQFIEMQGSAIWDSLMEKTRQPDDVFFPIIRTMGLGQGASQAVTNAAAPGTSSPSTQGGKYTLISRMDPLAEERKSGLPSRLVFLRGDFSKDTAKSPPLSESRYVSLAVVKVPHLEFSAWLQKQAPLSVPREAWQLAEALRKDGIAELLDAADGIAGSAPKWTIENIRDVIYPTEWEPANQRTFLERWAAPPEQNVDGKQAPGLATYGRYKIEALPGLKGASTATSFESRNIGTTLEMETKTDGQGVHISFSRVSQVAETVYRRIEDQGKWIPDVKLPLFASTRCTTVYRFVPGQWTMISTGSEYTGPGKVDREHCLLMFVKVE